MGRNECLWVWGGVHLEEILVEDFFGGVVVVQHSAVKGGDFLAVLRQFQGLAVVIEPAKKGFDLKIFNETKALKTNERRCQAEEFSNIAIS